MISRMEGGPQQLLNAYHMGLDLSKRPILLRGSKTHLLSVKDEFCGKFPNPADTTTSLLSLNPDVISGECALYWTYIYDVKDGDLVY